MNRDQLAALCRATVTLAVGAAPFIAIGWLVSWWLAAGVYLAGASIAGWWAYRNLPVSMPW